MTPIIIKNVNMYKSDQSISTEFNNFTIIDIELKRDNNNQIKGSGYITIEWPEGGDHVGGGLEDGGETCDYFIRYDHNGKIAFDSWYPEAVYTKLVEAIEMKMLKACDGVHKDIKDIVNCKSCSILITKA